MKLTLDYETRSEIRDLADVGPWKYARHPSTRVLCLGVKVDDRKTLIHYPNWLMDECDGLLRSEICLEEILHLADLAEVIEAHNVEFERAIWTCCYPGEPLPLEKLNCTASRAALRAWPRALGTVCKALGLSEQKDSAGHALMLKLCKPRKARKGEDPSKVYWHGTAEDFRRLGEYCRQDCEAEHQLSKRLGDLPTRERRIWMLDQTINHRGIPIDTDLVDAAIALDKRHRAELLHEFQTTYGIDSPSCLQKMLSWLNQHGVPAEDLTAETVRNLSAHPEYSAFAQVRRLLEIRQAWGKTSVAKFEALRSRVEEDGRARSCFLYHAATTGRWGGRGLQPQNLPSRGVISDPDLAIAHLLGGASPSEIQMLWGDPQWVLSGVIRGAIKASPGKTFLCADYSSIEGRGLAWLCGEEKILEAYRRGEDLYLVSASAIYGVPPDQITKKQRQVGKVAELACGYEGGAGAFEVMARGYGVDLTGVDTKDIVKKWRANRPMTVSWWRELSQSAIRAIENPGEIVVARSVSFRCNDTYLMCRLPSGHSLYYPHPSIGEKPTPWGDMAPVINFWSTDIAGKWCLHETYGGRLAENITQAVCRDVLAEALLRVEAAGFPVVLHVHDEVLVEVDDDKADLEKFVRLLVKSPDWAMGFPISADGWIGGRYKK